MKALTRSLAAPVTAHGSVPRRMHPTHACNSGEAGAMTFEEMNVRRFGLVGKLFDANDRGCRIEGSLAAVPNEPCLFTMARANDSEPMKCPGETT